MDQFNFLKAWTNTYNVKMADADNLSAQTNSNKIVNVASQLLIEKTHMVYT